MTQSMEESCESEVAIPPSKEEKAAYKPTFPPLKEENRACAQSIPQSFSGSFTNCTIKSFEVCITYISYTYMCTCIRILVTVHLL